MEEEEKRIRVIKVTVKLFTAHDDKFHMILKVLEDLSEKHQDFSIEQREKLERDKALILEQRRIIKHWIMKINKALTSLEPDSTSEYINEMSFFLLEREIDQIKSEVDNVLKKSIELLNQHTDRKLKVKLKKAFPRNFESIDDLNENSKPFNTQEQSKVFDYLNKEWVNSKPIRYAYIYRYMVDTLNMKIDFTTYNKFIESKYGKKVQRNRANSSKPYEQIRELMNEYNN